MNTVRIEASKKYDVIIGSGVLQSAGERIRETAPDAEKAVIVTDDAVNALYGDALSSLLASAGFQASRFVLPHGEGSKNAANFIALLNFFAEKGLSRSDMIVALGGGMTGDIAGFSAASYLRGIKCVQIPTTLLAMVDSSVGGKTAIDLEAGKNLAGAFCQPELVLCDYDTLKTLPAEYLSDGCAEIVKYGVLGDPALFEHMLIRGTSFDREYVISRCVAMKRDYVLGDELDNGERRKLNLGHTLGHAVEKRSGFALSHGKSVAVGLACVARAAAARGICGGDCADRIQRALLRLGLPVKTEYPMADLAPAMLSDKKRRGGEVSLIVPEMIGKCSILTMETAQAEAFMEAGL